MITIGPKPANVVQTGEIVVPGQQPGACRRSLEPSREQRYLFLR